MPHTTKLIYQGRILQLGLESLTLPNGNPLELEVVRHPGGAAVVALDRQDKVCLLRQYRHAGGGWLWELPAGRLEAHEQPRTTAARELVEEAGLQASRWDTLGKTLVTPAELGDVWSDLADIIGVKKSLTGEQRKKLAPSSRMRGCFSNECFPPVMRLSGTPYKTAHSGLLKA